MTRGAAWCLSIVAAVLLWWAIIVAVQLAVAAMMPVLVMMDK